MVERLRPRRAKLPKLPTPRQLVYWTSRWRRLSRALRRAHPVCQRCDQDLTYDVHHVRTIEEAPHLAYDPSNLMCLCRACHAEVHGGHTGSISEGGRG